MRATGKRSNTSRTTGGSSGGRRLAPAVLLCVLWVLGAPGGAGALDMLTLWRQPELPLRLETGAWADYRTQVMAGGRRESGLTRVACLGRRGDGADAPWILEMVPLQEGPDGTCTPVPADGVQLTVAASILGREGTLLDHVLEARRWQDDRWEPFDRQDLRRDPLLASSLEQDFVAGRVQVDPPTTRVIQGRELLCDQFTLAAADTQVAALPAGRMIQVTSREIAVAVHPEVPFLGLAYAAERVRSASSLDPPSSRLRPPPPQVRVEVMELVAYGTGAVAALGRPD